MTLRTGIFKAHQIIWFSDIFCSTAIIKHHSGTTDLFYVWFDDDRPRQNPEGQIVIDHWDLAEEPDEVRAAEERQTCTIHI